MLEELHQQAEDKIMELGFTGTQKGMTKKQKGSVFWILKSENVSGGHHGDCIGADRDFHNILCFLKQFIEVQITVHPPKNSSKQAFCEGNAVKSPEEYLVRNQHIVNETDGLIATPGEYTEQLRSGTWSTIRKGKKKENYPIWIVFPDGSVKKA